MRVIFIRHGRTQSNVGHLLDTGFPGAPLDETGEAQAAGLPGRLAGEPVEVVLTSDITRARQTAEPLAKARGVPLVIDPGVREIYAGDWDMDADWEPYQRIIASWVTDPTGSLPGGEDGVGFLHRFDAALAELADYDCVAVVSHGGALHTWLTIRAHMAVDITQTPLKNTDIVIVEGSAPTWRVLNWAGREL
ncbi:MAG: histidine phosphatase family protein [Propionibacteriaceae bacterium]|jgi:probable phosphoglycerate mutase|nr:histidine phosphatase family protein [Propionibacteriaceae bacterium]